MTAGSRPRAGRLVPVFACLVLAILALALALESQAAPMLGEISPAAGCADAYEPDNTPRQAHAFALDHHIEWHTFNVESDVDFYRIDTTAGKAYTVTTSRLISDTDTIMHLYRSDGLTLVAVNDDYPGGGKASRIGWTAQYDGVYYLRVRDFYWYGGCRGYAISGQGNQSVFRVYDPLINRPNSTPTPTDTPTPSPTPTATTTATTTSTPTPTDTPTVTPAPSQTDTPTMTPTSAPVATVPTTVPVAGLTYPNAVAVNPVSHRVYVTSRDNNSLIVLDGMSLAKLGQVAAGSQPWGVAVNPVTNKVYVANFGSADIDVFNGSTLDRIGHISVDAGAQLTLLAVNSTTNRIFAVSHGRNQVLVIDGESDTLIQAVGTGGYGAWGIAANPNLDRVYVSNRDSNNVVTLDGQAGFAVVAGQTVVPCGSSGSAYSLGFNAGNSRLYVACAPAGNVNTAVVYRASSGGLSLLAYQQIDTGGADGGGGVAIDTATGNTFFTNAAAGSVSVLGGSSNSLVGNISVGPNPFGVAADAGSRRFYVGNRNDNTLYVGYDNFPQ